MSVNCSCIWHQQTQLAAFDMSSTYIPGLANLTMVKTSSMIPTLEMLLTWFQAVFKNYDHDKDGFISHGEFDAIAGNFPFIDSFCVLDADE